jgi:hypothetical protein
MHRVHGPDTLFELFVAINPFLVIVLVPLVVTELRRREIPVHKTLFIGSPASFFLRSHSIYLSKDP